MLCTRTSPAAGDGWRSCQDEHVGRVTQVVMARMDLQFPCGLAESDDLMRRYRIGWRRARG